MFSDTLQGVRERRGRRWFLVLPVAFAGFFLTWIITALSTLEAMPWTWDYDDDGFWSGDIGSMVAAYTFVVLVSIVAPSLKRTAAAISAASWLSLLYVICRSYTDTHWSPIPYLVAGTGSMSLALLLVFIRCPARWMLIVPAYWLGFLTLMVPCLFLFGLLSPMIPQDASGREFRFNMAMRIVGFFAAFGAVVLPAIIVPAYPVRVAVGCFGINIAIGIASFFAWKKYGDISYFTLPELFLGGFAAVGFLLFRKNQWYFKPSLRRTDPSTSSG